jgi:hypothetical protein
VLPLAALFDFAFESLQRASPGRLPQRLAQQPYFFHQIAAWRTLQRIAARPFSPRFAQACLHFIERALHAFDVVMQTPRSSFRTIIIATAFT